MHKPTEQTHEEWVRQCDSRSTYPHPLRVPVFSKFMIFGLLMIAAFMIGKSL